MISVHYLKANTKWLLKVQQNVQQNGKEETQLQLVVRNDLKKTSELQAKYANRVIFVDEWKRTIDGQYKYKMDNFMHYLMVSVFQKVHLLKALNSY